MVCKKMFGGGMGDQIRRYCEDVKPEVCNLNCFRLCSLASFLEKYVI